MADILDTINAYKRREIAAAKERLPFAQLKTDAHRVGRPRASTPATSCWRKPASTGASAD